MLKNFNYKLKLSIFIADRQGIENFIFCDPPIEDNKVLT